MTFISVTEGTADAINDVDSSLIDIESTSNGITQIRNGAIYHFNDWEGTGILTQDGAGICKPVPYKNNKKGAMSNVFTGFEVVGWEGNGKINV